MVFGDSIETICCHSPDETAIVQIKRPARTVRQCLSIPAGPPGPGCPCCGPVTLEYSYAARPDHVGVYTSGQCDWLWVFPVSIPEACDACNSCTGDSYACGTAHSIFGTPMVDCPSCEYTRWTDRQATIAAASPDIRWWNDIQCYDDGGYISAADYGYAPTVAGDPCTRGSNPGGTYILADYYLGTFHRRITWTYECSTDTFGEGTLSRQCVIPESVSFVAAGAPLFEMDLYSATDVDKWGRYALSTELVERFICAVRNNTSPSQSDIEAVFAHPSGMLTTRDWREKQTSDDAYLATLYPTEYGGCTAQTALLGVCVKRCWPAIQPERVVSATTGLQATCLPTPTGAMEANPAWQIRRPTYFRPRPGFWAWDCATATCDDPAWEAECIRYDGAPFGTPTCSSSGPPCASYPDCDWCDDPGSCPPTVNVAACAVSLDCVHKMYADSCSGMIFAYAEVQLADCTAKHTCVKTDPEQACEDASCQGWYSRDSYVNFGYIYTVNAPCAWDSDTALYACLPQDPPVNVPQSWGSILGQSQLDEESARIANIAAGVGDCKPVQCEECNECTGLGFPVENIPADAVDGLPCGTYSQEGDNTSYNPCLSTCWEAPECEGDCQSPDATTCLPDPPDPCL